MPLRFDLAEAVELPPVLQLVREAILSDGLVRVMLAEGNWCLASAASQTAAERFIQLPEDGRAALMVSGPEAAADFIQPLPAAAARWLQGGRHPLYLEFSNSVIDHELVEALPPLTRQLVYREECLNLAPPSGPVTKGVLWGLPGPLLVCAAESTSAEQNLYDVLLTDSTAEIPAGVTRVRFEQEQWQVSPAGCLVEHELRRSMAQQIIFVCTGNTCRSPMAEAMFRHLLAERLGCAPEDLAARGFEICSAGLAAMTGAPASPESVQICARQGVDLHTHASQPLTESLLEQADRLYTMTAGHREAILARYPHLRDRVALLSRTGQDVTDPIGWGAEAYEQCFQEIVQSLRPLVDEFIRSAADDVTH